jgi:hypothetical protein
MRIRPFVPTSLFLLLGGCLIPFFRAHSRCRAGSASALIKGWRFMRYPGEPDSLVYEERPGNPADMTPFGSPDRAAFSGLALVIVRAVPGNPDMIRISATAGGLPPTEITIHSQLR